MLIKDVLNKFLDVVDKSLVIIGHNVAFDLRMIDNQLKKNGISVVIERRVEDTYKMSKLSLANLYVKLFGDTFACHRVKEDVLATMKCYFALKIDK